MVEIDQKDYATHGGFVSDLGRPLISLLGIRPGMRVLDLGCGDGVLSREMAALGAEVVGVDLSPDMVTSAAASGVDARVMDGQHLTFEEEFDAVFSNAALHWMAGDPQAVLAGVYRALKPGGLFLAEMGGRGNVARIVSAFTMALHHAGVEPDIDRLWYFPDRDEYAGRLQRAGFAVDSIEIFARPTPLPTGIQPWLKLFGRPLLARIPANDRETAISRIANNLEPYLKDSQGHWVADYVRLRFSARKPK